VKGLEKLTQDQKAAKEPAKIIPKGLTDKELMETDFPEPKWVIQNYLPEGETIFGGKSKIGKSWLALGIAIAAASGGRFFGQKVDKVKVLYLALEDPYRRLKKRLKLILQDSPALGNISFHTSWPRIDKGGLDCIREWLIENPDTKLVIIDVLQKIRPRRRRGAGVYEDDYEVFSSIQQVAIEYGVAILVIHHTNQGTHDDFTSMLSGSEGVPGAGDTIWVIKRDRGKMDAVLKITGRDIEEEYDLALEFDKTTSTWQLLGNAEEYRRSKERQDIIAILKQAGGPLGIQDIATSLGKQYNPVRSLLSLMAGSGEVLAVSRGKYIYTQPSSLEI